MTVPRTVRRLAGVTLTAAALVLGTPAVALAAPASLPTANEPPPPPPKPAPNATPQQKKEAYAKTLQWAAEQHRAKEREEQRLCHMRNGARMC